MNIRLFIILGCLSACFQNCKKMEEDTPQENPVYFTTLVDLELLAFLPDSFLCTATKEVPGLGSVSWTANCFAAIRDNKFGVGFVTYEDTVDLYARERLTISNIPPQKGFYLMKPYPPVEGSAFADYSRWHSDGDVLNALWEIDTDKNNYIEIDELNTETRRVSGKFDVHFKMTVQGSWGYVHSERINFKSGNFKAKLPE